MLDDKKMLDISVVTKRMQENLKLMEHFSVLHWKEFQKVQSLKSNYVAEKICLENFNLIAIPKKLDSALPRVLHCQ